MHALVRRPISSAPVRRQGFARYARRLTPPLTATVAPAQQVVSNRLTRLLRSFTTGSKREIPDNSRYAPTTLIVPDRELTKLTKPLN